MHSLLPQSREIRIVQHTGRIDSRAVEPVDQLLVLLPERVPARAWNSLPQGARLKALMRRRVAGSVPALRTRLSNKRQTLVVAANVAANAEPFEQLTIARKLVASIGEEKAGCVGVAVAGFDNDRTSELLRCVVAAALAAGFRMPAFRAEDVPERIRSIRLLGLDERIDVDRVQAEADGNNLARWLTAMPPNKLDADAYAAIVSDLAAEHGWEYERLGRKDLEQLGAGAFLAVAQGNDDDSAAILRLRYRPDGGTGNPALSLVGKGIIYDTGGTNLKPFQSMLEMHGDMQGSAVALGTLLAVTRLGLPMAVDCWLAVTENRTGPNAYKSQDVVKAANGKTIQVIHTDAEGRMALADTLVLASREQPGVIVDYATLTGSAINAVTTRYSAIFTNRPDWYPRLKRAGRASGERVWPFPSDGEFLEELDSKVADLQQCSVKGTGDHILAAAFLAEFVEGDSPWIHIDLAAGNHKNGLAHIPTDVTGFGVRYTLALVLDEDILGPADRVR